MADTRDIIYREGFKQFEKDGIGIRPVVTTVPSSVGRDVFNRQRVAAETPQIELKSTYGLSTLRDVVTPTGAGTVTHAGMGLSPEYQVSVTGSGDGVVFESVERGRYQPGYEAQCGVGLRLSTSSITNGFCRWGYFDDLDGFAFEYGPEGLSVLRLRGGVVLDKTNQSAFNINTLDGSPENDGATFNVTNGHIYQIDFSWYGYGRIRFSVSARTDDGFEVVPVHEFIVQEPNTTVFQPNLPIRVESSSTGSSFNAYVAGRQFSILGNYIPSFRTKSVHRIGQSGIGTAFVPLVSVKKRSNASSLTMEPEEFQIISDTNLIVQLRLNPTLTGAVFGTPPNTAPSESGGEVDNVATGISGGELLYSGLAQGAAGSRTAFSKQSILNNIPVSGTVTLCARTVSGTATVTSLLNWREEW